MNQQGGVIVNISSGWGREPEPGLSPYCTSKAAIEGLTQTVAQELPPNLSIVSLDPGGGIKTDILASCLPNSYPNAPSPDQWAAVAAPYILSLGITLTVPPSPAHQLHK